MSDYDVCEALADEFSRNFSSPSTVTVAIDSTSDSKFQVDISMQSLLQVLRDLPNSAAGPDGIPAAVYKRLAPILAAPLRLIFAQSLMQGVVPAAWKLAKVMPLYKGKSDRSHPGSFRPISLTCTACKILERLVVRNLTCYLQDNNVLHKSQHGFQNGKSNITNLLECDSFIADNLNCGRSCDVILIDFQRAFDKINHCVLCRKLKTIGIDGCYLRWIIDFSSNRWQYVTYGSASSELRSVSSGIVQGSALGPCIFTIFINDLSTVVKHAKSFLFADDLKLAGDVSTLVDGERMQSYVNAIADWSIENKLPISLPKFAVLHYGSKNARQQYVIHQQTVNTVNSCMDLGVLRCDTFVYNEHIRATYFRDLRLVGMVLKAFGTRQPTFLLKVFKAYIRPIVEYTSPVWSPSRVCMCGLLERVQRKFTKRLVGAAGLNYSQRLEVFGLASLEMCRSYYDMLLCFKCLHSMMAVASDLQLCGGPTRENNLRLQHYKPQSVVIAETFKSRAPVLWRLMPSKVLNCNSISLFKKALLEHLLTP